jgi:hypothetical protein
LPGAARAKRKRGVHDARVAWFGFGPDGVDRLVGGGSTGLVVRLEGKHGCLDHLVEPSRKVRAS